MKQIDLSLPKKQHNYTIFVGKNILEEINELLDLKKYSRVFVITDDRVAPLFLQKLLTSLPADSQSIILPAGENEKNIENAQKIWAAMTHSKLDRKSLVINLGGGVIGDIGGFTAATYMRGTYFINIPTTLLAQVDESVGGKTMVNFSDIKNLIGVFYQPSAVIIDTQTLETLPQRQFLSGFAEIIKHGLIADKDYFEKVTSKKPSEFSQEELIDIIARSCEIKRDIVEKDPEETSGLRKVVNFGHTIGHAIEAIRLETEKPLLHGEAVSIGCIAAARISESLGMLTSQDVKTIKHAFSNAGLPISIVGIHKKDILKKMQSDKKIEHGKIKFTLLQKIGYGVHDQIVSADLIIDAIDYISQ